MEKSAKIFELNSDLLERKFKFWNTFKIVLYSDKLFVTKRGLFGISYKEKTFDIDNIDSLFLKKRFHWEILLLSFWLGGGLGFIIGQGPGIVGILIIMAGIVFAFIGQKQFVISSHNDRIKISFSAVPKKQLNELTEKTLELKKKYKANVQTNVSLNNNTQQADFSEKLNKLKKLLDDGIINETEYKEKKKDVLKNI